jgi:hypothetical protein
VLLQRPQPRPSKTCKLRKIRLPGFLRVGFIRFCAMNYGAVECGAVRCSAMQCNSVQCGAVQCSADHNCAALGAALTGPISRPGLNSRSIPYFCRRQSNLRKSASSCSVQCSAVQCSAVLRVWNSVEATFKFRLSGEVHSWSRLLCSAVQCSAVQCSAVQRPL